MHPAPPNLVPNTTKNILSIKIFYNYYHRTLLIENIWLIIMLFKWLVSRKIVIQPQAMKDIRFLFLFLHVLALKMACQNSIEIDGI